MKTNKLFSALAVVLALSACDEFKPFEIPGGLDSSKPAVASLSYDDATSGANQVGLTWDATAALAAGATSFTVELTADIATDKVENGTNVKVVYAPDVTATFKGLNAGDFLFARVRANYDGYLYSNWTYIMNGATKLAVLVGTGAVEAEFTAPAEITATSTDGSLKATWSSVPFADAYVFEYKPASASDYSAINDLKTLSFEVEGLEADTNYDIRVKALKGTEETVYTYGQIKTKEKSKFSPNIKTAEQLMEFLATEAALSSSAGKFTLENDIDMTGTILPTAESFKGQLDGKGHSIKGLNIANPLFAEVSGTITNLVLEGKCTPGVAFFAPLAASNTGTISNVTNKCDVTVNIDAIPESMIVTGIVAKSSGVIDGCVNEGAITVKCAATTVAVAVAGIVGYQTAAIKNCTNKGAITLSATSVEAKSDIETVKSALPSLGGVCSFGAEGFSMDNCKNYGSVNLTYSAAETGLNATANVNRNQHGGVVASPCGDVSNCANYGEVNITLQHSTKGTAITGSGHEFIICVGGIGGGDYYFTSSSGTISNTNYINCTNEGNMNIYTDAAQANSAIGGIVGWPGQESPSPTFVKGCTNKGNITMDGVGKVRLGGIEGGTGNMENCTNEGNIHIKNAALASCTGLMCAFHSQTHAVTGCTAKGELTVDVALTDGVGGLIGNNGNAANTSGEGCVVNCKITTGSDATRTGFIVGYWNGTSKAVTLGSAEKPIKVAGTINGEAPSATNVCGTANATDIHVLNYSM